MSNTAIEMRAINSFTRTPLLFRIAYGLGDSVKENIYSYDANEDTIIISKRKGGKSQVPLDPP